MCVWLCLLVFLDAFCIGMTIKNEQANQRGSLPCCPNFRRYFLAAVCATNATWIFRVLIAWTAWGLTQSTSFAGLVTTLMLLPVAIASPIFGVLIDRSDPVRTYFWVSVGYLLCPLFYVAAHYFDILQPWVLLLLAGFYSLVVAVYQPLRQSLGPRLVDPDLIGSVMVLASLNHNTGRLVAPAAAGIGIATLGTEITSLMSILLYVPSLLVAFALAPRLSKSKTNKRGFGMILCKVLYLLGKAGPYVRHCCWACLHLARLHLSQKCWYWWRMVSFPKG